MAPLATRRLSPLPSSVYLQVNHLSLYLIALVVLSCLLPATRATAAALPGVDTWPPAASYVSLDNGLSPAVGYALATREDQLAVFIRVACRDQEAAEVELGISGLTPRRLTQDDATEQIVKGARCFRFMLTQSELGIASASWDELRLGLAVAWLDGPYGQARQRERFHHVTAAAPHAGLSPNQADWAPLSIQDYLDIISGNDRIRIAVNQPMAGKLTVVIEDTNGTRLRNLVAGQSMPQGAQQLIWDGLDDFGRLVAPGTYRWRSVSHPGITADYQFSFGNGGTHSLLSALSNHGLFLDACTNGRYVFLGAPLTEGGWALIALDSEGRWLRGFTQQHGTGYQGIAIAANDRYFLAVNDGIKKNRNTDTSKPDWNVEGYLTLTRWDVETGALQPYGQERFLPLETYRHGPGAATPGTRDAISLGGAALIGDELFISSRAAQAILVINVNTGVQVRALPLNQPGPVTQDGDRLLVASGDALLHLDPLTGATLPYLAAGRLQPVGLAVAPDTGNVYVSDGLTDTIQVFNKESRLVGSLGTPGGPYAGPFEPDRLVRPRGLAVFSGRLWVTEDRRNPKRATAWDLQTGHVVQEIYGNPPYGSPAASFDPIDPTRWIALRAGWKLDFKSGTATCTSVLQKNGGHLGGAIGFCSNYRWIHRDGRDFLLGQDKTNLISELMPDGSLRDLAMIGTAHGTLYAMKWQPVPGFKAAFEAKFPKASVQKKYAGSNDWRDATVLWIDANGDGEAQAEEFQIGEAKERFWGSGWGLRFMDLTMRFIVTRPDQQKVLVAMSPEGFLPGGAPHYPLLKDAIAAAVPLTEHPAGADDISRYDSTAVDSRGNLLLNSEPYMTAYSPAGKLLWHYPNRWVNVHGSHKAPLPSVGEMQGNLFFLGVAPLDAQTDVAMLVGNHGRFFVLDSQGFYLDEIFRDCRVGGPNDAQYIGGEAFGGVFDKTTDGRYLLQTGPGGFRIYEIHGLDQLQRQQGSVTVTNRQLELAAQRQRSAKSESPHSSGVSIPFANQPPKIDGKDDDWPKEPTAAWDRNGEFSARVSATWDRQNLYLLYRVSDPSPWRNSGSDWLTLFKTGDSVDLQLGADPTAKTKRREPAPGDLRLLLAPYQDKTIAVLYRYRQPGGENPVRFDSPWRSLQVDSVTQLTNVRAAVTRETWGYRLEVAIPLTDLGLDPSKGTFQGDFGALFGDAEGTRIALRSYWANPYTGLMYDVPGEAAITPNAWGTLTFDPEAN